MLRESELCINRPGSLTGGELGPITNSAWSIFRRIRITCLEDLAQPSGELDLSTSELGLSHFYYIKLLINI